MRFDTILVVQALGKSAHGSTPTKGDNAIARLARGLPEAPVWLEWAAETVDTTGAALGIAHRDDVAGPLTSNMGVLEYTPEGNVRLTYNIRYPVTWNVQALVAALCPALVAGGWRLVDYPDSPPLYVPLDKEPVSTLLRVYQEETGDTTTRPLTTGGGTYARATPNAVAYGPGFPGGSDGPAHEPDERIAIETVLNAAKIYAHALYELAR